MPSAPQPEFHRFFLVVWILQLVAVIIGSLLPGSMVPAVVGEHDKWVHFGGYVLLGFLPFAGARNPRLGLALAIAAIPMGGALELGQHFVPGRTPDWADAAANSMGVLAGVVVALAFRAIRARSRD